MMSIAARETRWPRAAAVALALQAGAELPSVEVASPGEHFVAAIEKSAGQERVPDALARWRVAIYPSHARTGEPLWSAPTRHDGEARRFALAEDGRAFASVEESYTQSRALVRIATADGAVGEYSASALGVTSSAVDRASRRWLAEGSDSVRWRWFETPAGPAPYLAVKLLSTDSRWIDAGSEEVLLAEPGAQRIAIEPRVAAEVAAALGTPFVSGRDIPARIRWGEALEVEVWGEHPTPNWSIVGFEASVEGNAIALVPRSAPPRGPQLQVLDSFRVRARIHGLAPGTYTVQVRGREPVHPEPAAVEVARAPAVVEWTRRGGILGLDERLRLFAGGIALLESNRLPGGPHASFASAEDLARIQSLMRSCETQPPPARIAGADLLESTLEWESGGRRFALATNEPAPTGPLGQLLEMLVRLRP